MSELLVCFHGSPGVPDEFEGLAESLPGMNVRAVVRHGYPAFRQYPRQADLDEPCVVVGYSFGCVAALKAAAFRPKNVRAAILIAPYLFVERPWERSSARCSRRRGSRPSSCAAPARRRSPRC